jgi:hypothetical protein
MAYQCMAKEVCKTPTAKNFAIVMPANKKFLPDYLLKTSIPKEKHPLQRVSLEVVMDEFVILASSNYRNIVEGFKRLLQSDTRIMDGIMALKDHSRFKFVHDSHFLKQSKGKVFVFKMSVSSVRHVP